MFNRLTRAGVAWADGTSRNVDAIIWCTGFRPGLKHLRRLRLRSNAGRVVVGLAGVGPSAKATATAVADVTAKA